MNAVLIVQLEDLDDNPPEFEFEEKTRDPRSGYAYAKCLFHQIIVYVYEYNTIIYSHFLKKSDSAIKSLDRSRQDQVIVKCRKTPLPYHSKKSP